LLIELRFLGPIIAFVVRACVVLILAGVVVSIVVAILRNSQLRLAAGILVLCGLVYAIVRTPFARIAEGILSNMRSLSDKIGAALTDVGAPLAPITHWIGTAVRFLIAVVAVVTAILAALGMVGAVLVDQVRSAWHAGNGPKSVLLASFSIGFAFAIVCLE